MTLRISDAARTAACNTIVDLIDVGTGTAKLQLWSGARPFTTTGAPSGVKLAEFNLPNPAFGNASVGVATAAAISGVNALATGTIGFARILDRNGTIVWDNNDVGTSTQQIQVSSLAVNSGSPVTVTSWTVTMPAL